jgi:flagellar biosynthesis protein FlhB
MADAGDKETRTEEATEKKIRDAVEKGNVPLSREAPIFASFAGILIISAFFMKESFTRLALSLQRLIDSPGEWSLDGAADAIDLFAAIAADAGRALVASLVVLTLAGIAASMLQNAPRLAPERIKPELSRISLAKGWERLFGMRGWVEFLKAFFKFVAVSVVVLILLRSEGERVISTMSLDPAAIPELILSMSMRLLAAVSVATIVLVAADLVWARLSWRRDLRMTRQEVKDEIKDAEGDPIVRSRLRSLARDRSRRRMIAAVPRATLVLANPTHYAIALRYVPAESAAPLVLAKGKDLIALKIREIAEKHEIPVVEDKALVRSMYDHVEVDRMIPPDFYRAVAEIIHFLHSRAGAAISR